MLLLGLFVAGHVTVQLGWLQRRPGVYVALLNAAQPEPETVSTRHGGYGSRSES
ncbi:hypothetical protein [Haloplanus aerogenes]|uniref:hypothetical protein n=1 Tax=Haloplanus aerogenes TaxID=660522 RepID=UPI00131499F5|nr:hypothetical protein [Haloplanus aerogenes]